MVFGGRKDKLHMGWRLFKRLEEGIKSWKSQHVHFINDIYAILARRRHISGIFPQISDLVNTPVGCPIDFLDVYGRPIYDFHARLALITWYPGLALFAIDGLSKDSSNRGFADTSGSAEEIGMCKPVGLYGIGQCLCNVFLSNDVLEYLRTPFSG